MDAADIESSVYMGVWTNWSRGALMGRTLTLTRWYGNIVIAVTASFVAFVALRFWYIMCLSCFRWYSSSQPRSVLYHQRQVLLRNSVSGPGSGLYAFFTLFKAWWPKTASRLRLTKALLPITCLALAVMIGFIVAGVFSATIASAAGDVVLLAGVPGRCGSQRLPADISELLIRSAGTATIMNNAANYAQQCYNANSTGILNCQRFVEPKLSWHINTTAGCPFHNASACRLDDRNIRLDTGPIDFNKHLGLNTPPQQRSSLQYVLHCAPLKTEGMTSPVSEGNETWIRYGYGPFIASTDLYSFARTEYKYTYELPTLDSQYKIGPFTNNTGYVSAQGVNFRLISSESITGFGQPLSGASLFIPQEGLRRSDGDVSIAFLSGNGIMFPERWTDEWYRATKEGDYYRRYGGTSENKPVSSPTYMPSEAASPLGCVDQYQFCNQDNCTALLSFVDALQEAAPIFNTTFIEIQHSETPPADNPNGSRLWWIKQLIYQANRRWVVGSLGAQSLSSQILLYNGMQLSPRDTKFQWHQDVIYWFNTSLAAFQAGVTDFVLGPSYQPSDSLRIAIPFSDETSRNLCSSQKIRSSDHTSFNVFGLAFTYVVGCLIILVSWSLEPILGALYKRYGYQGYQHLEWSTNAPLQLHRLAQEELGQGNPWSNCAETVPFPDGGNDMPLAGLDILDPNHPILSRPSVVEVEKAQKPQGPDSIGNLSRECIDTPAPRNSEDCSDEHGQSQGADLVSSTLSTAEIHRAATM